MKTPHYMFPELTTGTFFRGEKLQLIDPETELPPTTMYSDIKIAFALDGSGETKELSTLSGGVTWIVQEESEFQVDAQKIDWIVGIWNFQLFAIDANGEEHLFMYGQWPIRENLSAQAFFFLSDADNPIQEVYRRGPICEGEHWMVEVLLKMESDEINGAGTIRGQAYRNAEGSFAVILQNRYFEAVEMTVDDIDSNTYEFTAIIQGGSDLGYSFTVRNPEDITSEEPWEFESTLSRPSPLVFSMDADHEFVITLHGYAGIACNWTIQSVKFL